MSLPVVIENEILVRVADAGFQLRFDKVALRLLYAVEASVAGTLPADRSTAFAITAPIRLPKKITVALQEWLSGLCAHESSATIYGNKVKARILCDIPPGMPRVIGFVHSCEGAAQLVLNIAEEGLRHQ